MQDVRQAALGKRRLPVLQVPALSQIQVSSAQAPIPLQKDVVGENL